MSSTTGRSRLRFALFTLALGAMATGETIAGERAKSEWVYPGPNGKLVYKTTPTSDRIMDFSHAGYMGGGVALPDVAAKKTVQPSGGADDTKFIQSAIDEVAKLPLDDKGFRGAVLLGPGTFTCAETISIPASGVVLRGSGSGASEGEKTTIKLSGKPHLALAVRAPEGGGRGAQSRDDAEPAPTAKTDIADAYVPAGATSFAVADAKGFAVGDTIVIRRPVTEAWVKFMQMHDMTRDGKPQTWIKAGSATNTERVIAAIDGNKITVDVPLADNYDATHLSPPGTTVSKIAPPKRLSQVGIENLHVESPQQEITHSQPHFTALRLNGQDCWVRDVIFDETMNSVSIGGRRITLQSVAVNRKAKHQGASKPAEFAPNGGQVLLDRCTVNGDNVWFVATGGGNAGPVVILNCTFNGNGKAESHQRWSTGMLYDNCRAPGGGIELRNRGSMGSGHGWSMGWGVVWNCVAKDYIVQNPPGAVNWVIGSSGHRKLSPRPFGTGPDLAEATVDSHEVQVAPQSLYLAQLNERLGPAALKNIGYASPNIDDTPPSQKPAAVHTPAPAANADALGENLAIDRPVTTSNVRDGNRQLAGWQALDGDDATWWATDDGSLPARLELDTEGSIDIDTALLAEANGMEGRVKEYTVEGFTESAWKLLSEGTSIGKRKLDRFPRVTVWKVRLTITKAEPSPAIREFGLYLDASPAAKRTP